MRFLVFNFRFFLVVISLLSLSHVSAETFKLDECIQSEFNTQVSHKGWPFGLHEVVLKIDKKQCQLNIYHEHFKYLKKNWNIDVCRGPVHIKMGTSSIEVFKRRQNCDQGSDNSGFCSRYGDLTRVLQDDGLIFAQGEKEDLNADHGRVNCVHMLVKEYLNNGFVFSLHAPNELNASSGNNNLYAKEPTISGEDSSSQVVPARGMPADF